MSDYVRLIGTEDVQQAARNMAGAAEDFGRHVGYLSEHLSGFLVRFEELVVRMEAAAAPPPAELLIQPPQPPDPEAP